MRKREVLGAICAFACTIGGCVAFEFGLTALVFLAGIGLVCSSVFFVKE